MCIVASFLRKTLVLPGFAALGFHNLSRRLTRRDRIYVMGQGESKFY